MQRDHRWLVSIGVLSALTVGTLIAAYGSSIGPNLVVDVFRFELPAAILAVAFHLTYYAGNTDLALAGLYPVCLVAIGSLAEPTDLSILLVLIAAGIAGLVVGQTYWVLRSSLIPGLFGYSVFRGIAFNISDVSLSVSTQSSGILRAFGSPRWSLIAQMSVLGVFLVIWSMAARTDVGRRWRAVGLDARWANHAGIRVRKTRLLAQCVAGVMAGVAATMAASKIGTVGPEVGDEVLLTAPVAAVIGNGGLARWAPAPSRVVIASFLLATLRSELSLVGLGPDRVTMIVGLIGFATLLVERVFGRTWGATPIA